MNDTNSIKSFCFNGYQWNVKFVDPDSPALVDRTWNLRVATTDPTSGTVFLSTLLYGQFLNRVLVHELGHCMMFSYNLLPQIHRMVRPEYWIEAEEWVCNFIADYGWYIFETAYDILGEEAWQKVPKELERWADEWNT